MTTTIYDFDTLEVISTNAKKDNKKEVFETISVYEQAKNRIKYRVLNSKKYRSITERINEINTIRKSASFEEQIELKKELTSLKEEEKTLIALIKNINSHIGNMRSTQQNQEKIKATYISDSDVKFSHIEFSTKRNEIERKLKLCNINSILTSLYEYRRLLDCSEFDFDAIEYTDLSPTELKYVSLIEDVAQILSIDCSELNSMQTSDINKLLIANQTLFTENFSKYTSELSKLMQDNAAMLHENSKKTQLIESFFELYSHNEEVQREFLVLFSTNHIQNCKNKAKSSSMRMTIDESLQKEMIAAANFGLAKAINKFFELRHKNEWIDFFILSHKYVYNEIQKTLYDSGTSGTISSNAILYINSKKRQNIELSLSKLKSDGISDESILSVVRDMCDEKSFQSIEIAINSNGDEYSFFDTYDNKEVLHNSIEEQSNYVDMMKSIDVVFSLYYLSDDKEKITNKKIFDKYDKKLFMLTYGFEQKNTLQSIKTMTLDTFLQKEIAIEFEKYYAENGIKKTFTQEAIAYRQKTLREKLSYVYENIVTGKAAIRNILNYFGNSRVSFDYFNSKNSLNNKAKSIEIYTENQHSDINKLNNFDFNKSKNENNLIDIDTIITAL